MEIVLEDIGHVGEEAKLVVICILRSGVCSVFSSGSVLKSPVDHDETSVGCMQEKCLTFLLYL